MLPILVFGCSESASELLPNQAPSQETAPSTPALEDGGSSFAIADAAADGPMSHAVDASDEGGGTLPPAPGSGLCGPCTTSADCTQGRACLMFTATNERFCAQDCSVSACPTGYACAGFATQTGAIFQCVPSAGSCKTQPMPSATVDAGGSTGSGATSDLQHCVDVINGYRAKVGASPLARSSALEAYAAAGATSDSQTNQPHGHFITTAGGGIAFAENEIPGWPLASYQTTANVIERGTLLMWNEGPGGGHYQNLVNTSFTQVGCGVHATTAGAVWVTQDFR
jgi:uncharacterized protein YkwD